MSGKPGSFHPSRNDNNDYYKKDNQESALARKEKLPNQGDFYPEKMKMLPATVEEYYGDGLKTFEFPGHVKVVTGNKFENVQKYEAASKANPAKRLSKRAKLAA